MPREESNMPHITSSFTALAFAPGVLNTTIPFLVASSMGILFVPAPARATHFRLSPKSSFVSAKLLNNKPSGLSETSLKSLSPKIFRPSSAILLKILKLNIFFHIGRFFKKVRISY